MNNKKKRNHLSLYTAHHPKYPNAAEPRYFTQKAIDVATAILSGMGMVSAMLFLVTMS